MSVCCHVTAAALSCTQHDGAGARRRSHDCTSSMRIASFFARDLMVLETLRPLFTSQLQNTRGRESTTSGKERQCQRKVCRALTASPVVWTTRTHALRSADLRNLFFHDMTPSAATARRLPLLVSKAPPRRRRRAFRPFDTPSTPLRRPRLPPAGARQARVSPPGGFANANHRTTR